MRTIILSLLLGLAILPARADDLPTTRSNAIAILGKPALPPDFPYFPYVNPNAPKGGEVTLASIGTFDSFNPFILRGTSASGMVSPWVILPGGSGSGATVGHVWESLLTSSADEVATGYGHLAETIELPANKLWVAFELRPEAKFSDGTPVTAEDVAWTYRTLLEQGRPEFPHPDGRREGRGGGKSAARGVSLQVEREPRAAADPGRPACAAQAFLRRSRLHQAADRSADRLGTVPDRKFRTGPQHHLCAPARLVGGEHADRQGHQQLRSRAYRVFPRLDRGDGGVQGWPDRSAQREHLEELGHRLRLPGRCARAGDQAGIQASPADRHAGISR